MKEKKAFLIIKETALRTLNIEIDALENLKEHIGASFCEAVWEMAITSGKIVVTGIGKSAIVGKKIVATLNSTGRHAVFLHAADAIHGDIGIVGPEDVVLCLSKSGETPEIKVLVPLLKRHGNKLIGMVSRTESYLGQQADYVLLTPIDREADPNNLAPTASTTAQIALGDAIATSLLALKGFSPSDFAMFHPGGTLGKQLYLRVKDMCQNHPKPEVNAEDTLKRVIVEITSKRLGATAVITPDREVEGIITDGDLRRMLETQTDVFAVLAKDIMTRKPKTIQGDELAVKALEVMRQYSISQLLVVDDKHRYIGMVHLHDLIREGLV